MTAGIGVVCGLRLLLSGLQGGERRERRISDSCAHVLSLAEEEELRCKQKSSQEPSGQASIGQRAH